MTAYSIDFRRPLVNLLSATLILSQARPTVRMHLRVLSERWTGAALPATGTALKEDASGGTL